MTKPFDPFDPDLLWGKFENFSDAEKKRREAYVDLVHMGLLEPLHCEWLITDSHGFSADPVSRITTYVFNTITDSHGIQRRRL